MWYLVLDISCFIIYPLQRNGGNIGRAEPLRQQKDSYRTVKIVIWTILRNHCPLALTYKLVSHVLFWKIWHKYSPWHSVNTLRPRKCGRQFPDDIFSCIFLNENEWHSIYKISLKFVPKVPINNIPALVQIMAWRQPGDKPLSEQWRLFYRHIYASIGLNELTLWSHER